MSQPRSLADKLAALERSLQEGEQRMLSLQRGYERTAEQFQALRRAARMLAAEDVPMDKAVSWAGVCRLKRWNAQHGEAHRTVKRRDQRLHVLLHQALLGETCALDHTNYPLE